MGTDLLKLPAIDLLEKFGAGNHKPGSGSAAALNGILSSKLLLTVIELSLDQKRKNKYAKFREEFTLIREAINDHINPRLVTLFEDDSKQFDIVIKKRDERDEEANKSEKNRLEREALEALRVSIEIPIEIAENCINLAKFAIKVFDKGFQSARGDSSVALNNALSGIVGCISIISLNLQSFPKNEWTIDIQNQNKQLTEEFNLLSIENFARMNILEKEAEKVNDFRAEFNEVKESLFGKSMLTYAEIEKLTRRIQNSLWEYKDLIWKGTTPSSPIEILKPKKVIELLKYAFEGDKSLGLNEQNERIAGIINNRDSVIKISKDFSPEITNFTTAHELGHALMHDKLELHRDIPIDGSETRISRPIEELQADKFASFFLMPEKIVKQFFRELFQLEKFTMTSGNVFALTNSSVYELRKKLKSKRDLSRMIANCEHFDSNRFTSLSKTFNVSTEAMAIRLEELNLVEYNG